MPDDRTLVIERYRDELGDWRVCVLAPYGGQVLAPWAMAAEARIREQRDIDVETMWSDDGFVVRFPDTDEPPDAALLVPPAEEVERLLLRQLGGTALFAARFREVAARALLLPRRRPGARTPLWQQRKRASDLLAVAARFGSFPALLETYRECLRDQFDVPALVDLLGRVGRRSIRTVTIDTEAPSPFASSLLFAYTANFIYDGDAPLAERRAQALLVDQSQLQDLLGDIELRELLDPAVIDEVEQQLQRIEPRYRARSRDALHDMLLRLGDLDSEEIRARSESADCRAVDSRAGRRTARDRGAGGGFASVHRRGGCRPVPRCAGRPAAARPPGCAARTACRSRRRSRLALRADARAVPHRGRRGPPGTAPESRRWRPRATRGARTRAAGRVHARAGAGGSGARRTCCATSASARWRSCGTRWSR